MRGTYGQTASAVGARLGVALRLAAARGREAQLALLSSVITAVYVFTQPPTALWRALSGLDFLAGLALLAMAAPLAAIAHSRAPTKAKTAMHPGGQASRGAELSVRRAAIADAAACIAAPWVALALGLADESTVSQFGAPQFWYVALAAAARAAAEFTSATGAARTAGAVAAAADALRLAALWRLASPVGGAAALLQLAAVTSACHAFFVARLGAELPAMAALRAGGEAKEAATKATPQPARRPAPASPVATPPAATDSVSPRGRHAEDATSEVMTSPRDPDDEREWAMPPRQPRSPADEDQAAAAAMRIAKEAISEVEAAESGATPAKKRA